MNRNRLIGSLLLAGLIGLTIVPAASAQLGPSDLERAETPDRLDIDVQTCSNYVKVVADPPDTSVFYPYVGASGRICDTGHFDIGPGSNPRTDDIVVSCTFDGWPKC